MLIGLRHVKVSWANRGDVCGLVRDHSDLFRYEQDTVALRTLDEGCFYFILLLKIRFLRKENKMKKMDDKEIVHERLEYTLEKNKGLFFDITPNSRKL